ncbi:DUF429 domain-containing protein [Tepidiforma sp.]|uniref:DUF429 domain-containing protein n=1 Tax=Tepidiforma sp. TaxID=2682230 RepID=UPI002ADDD347|nr:DUF429 domain-containing protein [Tepidiforma sp.]
MESCFVGIDLSWTARRPSGLAVIEHTPSGWRLSTRSETVAAWDLANWLSSLGERVVVGVDAPLVVGPDRTAEAEMAGALGGRGVRAFAAGTAFLERHNFVAGPELARALAAAGWTLGPPPGDDAAGRFAFETFPRGLAVTLLGFERPPEYKRGPLVQRGGELARLRDALADRLEQAAIPGDLPELPGAAEGSCPLGRALKDAEDRLDAALCALAAFTARAGVDRADRFGAPEAGEIVLPGASGVTSAPGRSSPSG